jgi:hypothetical protein
MTRTTAICRRADRSIDAILFEKSIQNRLHLSKAGDISPGFLVQNSHKQTNIKSSNTMQAGKTRLIPANPG